MPSGSNPKRVNTTLDATYAAKLQRLAEQARLSEETLARSLLATALDDADPDPRSVTELLDAIPHAFSRAQHGLAQVRDGLGTPLDEL